MKPRIKNKTSNKIPNGVKTIRLCINQTKEPNVMRILANIPYST